MQWIRQLAVLVILLGSGKLNASDELWQAVDIEERGSGAASKIYRADDGALRASLARAPHESSGDDSVVIQLPQADGSLGRFSVVESPIMQPGLAADFPEIKTYKLRGIDDPSVTGRADISPRGFHAMLIGAQGRLFIDPKQAGPAPVLYQARKTRSASTQGFQCGVESFDPMHRSGNIGARQSAARMPGVLLEYRLAVSATEEYVDAVGDPGDTANAQAAIVTAINRVNEIYERDLGIRLSLVMNNQNLIEPVGGGIFTNNNAFTMFAENQSWIDAQIGSGNYDIGHVFSTGGGGLAFLGSVCDNPNKAKGVSGQPTPLGDPFHIDFVAHEIGHQFNADHSFNGTTLSCGSGNRNAATAFEPGSGSTIMAYAGICGVEDLQINSDATFHAGSIGQIDTFANAIINPPVCGTTIATMPAMNTDPSITVPQIDATIPVKTAFALDASAADADVPAQTLLYQWDQIDAGDPTDAVSFGTDKGNNPLFRSYPPQLTSRRDFPALGTQVGNNFDDAEVVPCNARALDFRLTVRDQASGQVVDDVRVTTTTSAGPFRITNYATPQTIVVNSNNATLTWDRANTDLPPVSCPTVDIDLLTFSDPFYTQYSVHNLMTGVTNNNSQLVSFPDTTLDHPRARFRIRCSNNIFYDISDADLVIEGTGTTQYTDTDFTTFFNNGGTVGGTEPACGTPDVITTPQAGSRGDSGAFDYWWLLLLGGLAGIRWRFRA